VAQVDAAGVDVVAGLGGKWRVLAAHAEMPEEPFEDDFDGGGLPEDELDPRATAAKAEHDEIAGGRVARSLSVDNDRCSTLEVGLADEELPAAGELADRERRHLVEDAGAQA